MLPLTKAKARIQALDVIRGLSILGILVVNADGFAAPKVASLNAATWPFPNEGWTAISYWVMQAFFHEKFVTLFTMLFGVSLFLVGGERSDKTKSRILRRRLGILFLFAMLHGFGIWWGDILALYASTGFIMAFCRSWQPKTLLLIGFTLYALMGLRNLQPTTFVLSGNHSATQTAASLVARETLLTKRKAQAIAEIAEAKSSWVGAYRLNTRSYLQVLSGYPWLLPSTLGLMMIGLSLFKSGFLAGRSSNRRYSIVFAGGMVALALIAWQSWQTDVNGVKVVGSALTQYFLAPLISLAYASGLILLLRFGATGALSLLSAAGRMAFTNYLTQSLLMTSVFYGGRGALMGEVDRPLLWVFTLAIWALQITWSRLWLARFEMGPFEWVWRCLTYGQRVPILKQR